MAFIMNPVFAVSFMEREEHLDRRWQDAQADPRLPAWAWGVLVLIAVIGYLSGSAFRGQPDASCYRCSAS
ncbi:MAG: hypothetical protein WKG07_14730 [Hymenobacter sp.]